MSKARISDPDGKIKPFEVPFNPNTLTYSVNSNRHNTKGARDSEGPGRLAGVVNEQSDPTAKTDQASMSVRLFYHTYKSETSYEDVRGEIEKLRVFVRTGGNTGENDLKIKFAWGTWSFEGFLDAFSVTYQMFAADGTPVQAEVSITIVGEDPDYAALAENVKKRAEAVKAGEAPAAADEIPIDWEWLFE